jgi:predicted permease
MWLKRRDERERLLDEELRDHVARQTADYIRDGMAPGVARRRALVEFGGEELAKEECRDLRAWRIAEQVWRDVGYAARMLVKRPGLTAVAVLSLGLGIGANTTIFSAIDALMLRPLPARNPEQLLAFRIDDRYHSAPNYVTLYPLFERYQTLTRFFSDIAMVSPLNRAGLKISGVDAGQARVALVSGSYFPMLGVNPAVGRYLTPDDDRVLGGHPVAVISSRMAARHLPANRELAGQTLTLLGVAYTVVGVMPPGFSGSEAGRPVDVWVPVAMAPQANPERRWPRFQAAVIARLKPGESRDQAEAAARVIFRQSKIEDLGPHPRPEAIQESDRESRLTLEPAGPGYSVKRHLFRQPLTILMIVVALVLIIACLNTANLLLARSEARRREMAVRLAIGAGAGRIAVQLLTESLLLAGIAGAAGLAFARWGMAALANLVRSGPVAVNANSIAMDLDDHMDWRILAFTAGLCMLNGILFGLAPAFRGSRVLLAPALIGRSADTRIGTSGFGLGKALVVGQVAATLVLLVAAGLFVRSLRNLRVEDLGIDRKHILLVWAAPSLTARTGTAVVSLYEKTQQRISALPGVVATSCSVGGLLNGGSSFVGPDVHVLGYTPRPGEDPHSDADTVMPKYFDAAGMRLLAGRDFNAGDTENAPRVVIIDETIAKHFFPGQNPIGRRIGFNPVSTGAEFEIVGVVSAAKRNTPREGERMSHFIPYLQDVRHLGQMCLLVRTAGPPAGLANRVRDELRAIDPDLPIVRIETVDEQVDDVLVPERLVASLAACLGAVAVLLACLGVYGVTSYKAALRTNEMGIRLALGATRGSIVGLVLRDSLSQVAIGILLGVPLILAVGRLAGSLLFGVGVSDPVTVAGAGLLLLAVAGFAGYLPATRVSQVDPASALRHE